MHTDIITIGDSVLDTYIMIDDATVHCDIKKEHCKLCLNYAEKIPITGSAQSVGGNAANVAVGTHLFGLNSTIITEVGDDLNGHIILSSLKKVGVNIKHIQVKKQETRYAIVLNFKGERTILSQHPKRNYTLLNIPKTNWIYYTSLSKSFEKIQKKLISHLKKNPSIKLAVNPGTYQLKDGLKILKKILPYAHAIILNKEEAEIIVGKKKTEKSTLKALLETGAKIAVITNGKKGSYTTDGKEFLFMPIYPLKAKAKTGAGDAFTSGFLSALVQGHTIKEAVQWGTANSAGVIQKFGAQVGLLSKRQTLTMIKKYKKIIPKSI
ncbi:MAG: carbohydrate kinase family protein [Candidatus Magasanikbacteria bacterium]|nr:carbohydrate kinase family protein [Candidatus Magasanikbacteria bacterium]